MKAITSEKVVSPSVRYIVSVLRERIHSGEYIHGRWLPSERALAEEFAVCRPTVRQAIVELEQGNLIQRTAGHRPVVWNRNLSEPLPDTGVPEELTSWNSSVDANLPVGDIRQTVDQSILREERNSWPSRARQSIGLWISGTPRDMGPVALTNGVHQGLAVQDRPLRVVMACPQGSDHEDVIRSEAAGLRKMAEDEDIAGVILWYLGGETNLPVLEELRAAGKTLVFVDREPPDGFEADFVGVYNAFAAAEAVRYLIKLGHRNILHLTNPDHATTVRERFQGYQQALREAGIPFRPEYVMQGPFKSVREEEDYWQELVKSFSNLPEPPTAAFAVNDYNAYRLIRALRTQGLRVPEDMAVIGFDDSERWSAVDPFMTSVSQPFEQIGLEAARLLLLRYEYPQIQTYRHVLLPATLVLRRSSGDKL